jgi:hypothetical protein
MLAGLMTAFAAANELPALSLLVAVAAVVTWRSPKWMVLGFVPAVALVAVAFFGTNYLAHSSWKPPYAHRGDGGLVVEWPDDNGLEPVSGSVPDQLRRRLDQAGLTLSEDAILRSGTNDHRWVIVEPSTHRQWSLVQVDGSWQVRQWDNWYDYEKSYWRPENKRGIDRGEPQRAKYAFHVLVGHHGVFSLTPIWLLSIVGLLIWLREPCQATRILAAITLGLTVVCVAFYLTRPLEDRNYGGVTSGFRWMFWFAPLWLVALLPAADRISTTRIGRGIALLLLLLSAMSAHYASANPWSHPWLYNYWEFLGWLENG